MGDMGDGGRREPTIIQTICEIEDEDKVNDSFIAEKKFTRLERKIVELATAFASPVRGAVMINEHQKSRTRQGRHT